MRIFSFRKAAAAVVTAIMIAATFVVPASALAQTSNTGAITGTVKDPAGAVVSGASVRAVNKATNIERKTTTSDSGSFELSQLTPGEYRVEVEAKGFGKYIQEPVVVNVLSRVTLDADLKTSGAAEQITVTGGAAPLVETTKTDVGGVVDKRELESLPVNGRSFASLAVLIPGATQAPSFDPTKARSGTFSIGGSTGRNINITVDGGDNKDNVVGGILQNYTMEGIQEFALSTQRFSAANGRSGGALLSVINKSGTNQLTGTVFGFFRDDKFNANALSLLADHNPIDFDPNAEKLPFNRQQFGGSIGGPIIKDKAFWFGTVEHTRERGASAVPAAFFNQIQLLAPLGYTAVSLLTQPFDDTQFTVKGDFHPRDNHTISVRYSGQNNKALNDQAGFFTVFTDAGGGDKQINDLHSLLGSWTWTATPHVVNQLIYQWSTFNNQILATSSARQLIFPDGVDVGTNTNVPQQTTQRKHQLRDDLSWSRGNHGLKFGVDYVPREEIGGLFHFFSTPTYFFNLTINEIVGLPQRFNTPGIVDQISLGGGDPSTAFLSPAKQLGWYVQDDWKVNSKLTLSLGVRYDVDLGFVDAGSQANNRAVRALQIIGSSYGNLPHDDKNNFSPRIGFAWDLRGNGRQVLRGGYGLYYDQSFQNVVTFAVQQAHPEIYGQVNVVGDNLSLATPPPVIPSPFVNPLPGTRGRIIDPNFTSPYTQQSNIGYAHQIGNNMVLEFDYVHILGLHEFNTLDINPRVGPLFNAQASDPASAFPRVFQNAFAAHAADLIAAFGTATPFARISAAQSDGRSRYDAFTVSFRKRYSRKFQFETHYTWARARAWFGSTGDFGLAPINPFDKFDPNTNFGPSDADERHRFVLSGVWDLPWGFQLSPIFQLASARPYSILAGCGCDANRDGVANDRGTIDGNDQHQFAPNSARGDWFSQVNIRVAKNFKLRERMKLGLFFEAFNLFNTANFGAAFQNAQGAVDFGKPIGLFGATGFSEPLGIA